MRGPEGVCCGLHYRHFLPRVRATPFTRGSHRCHLRPTRGTLVAALPAEPHRSRNCAQECLRDSHSGLVLEVGFRLVPECASPMTCWLRSSLIKIDLITILCAMLCLRRLRRRMNHHPHQCARQVSCPACRALFCPVVGPRICDQCQQSPATARCDSCGFSLCPACLDLEYYDQRDDCMCLPRSDGLRAQLDWSD